MADPWPETDTERQCKELDALLAKHRAGQLYPAHLYKEAPVPGQPHHTQACTIVRDTDNAILIEVDGETYWMPLSQVSSIRRTQHGEDSVTMTAWIAKQKGLL